MKNAEKEYPYDDIIRLSRPVSGKYPPMPAANRAAQFSPFAALTGYHAAIGERARLTEEKKELGEETKEILGRRLYHLNTRLKEKPQIEVTYFVPDEKKEGGLYARISGRIKKLDIYGSFLIMEDGTKIYFDDISELSGGIFDGCGEPDMP